MDEELKAYLIGMEERTAALIKGVITGVEERTAALIAGEVGTIHTEMQQGFARVDALLSSIDARLRLQAGLIQAGGRAMARFSEFSENSETRWVDIVTRLAVVERKLGLGKPESES